MRKNFKLRFPYDAVRWVYEATPTPSADLVYENFGRLAIPSLTGFAYGAGTLSAPIPVLYIINNIVTDQKTSLTGLAGILIPTVISGGLIGMTFLLAISSTILRLPSIYSLRRIAKYGRLLPPDSVITVAARLATIEFLFIFILLGGFSPLLYLSILDPLSKFSGLYGARLHEYDARLVWLSLATLVAVSCSIARWNIHRRSGAPLALKATLIYLHLTEGNTTEEAGFWGPTADPIGKNRAALTQLADRLEVYANWLPQISAREVVSNPMALVTRGATRSIRTFVRGRTSLEIGSSREIDQVLQELAVTFSGPRDITLVGRLADRLEVFNEDGTPSEELATPAPGRFAKALQKSSARLEATERRVQSFSNLLPIAVIGGVVILAIRGDWAKIADLFVGLLG
ncbi:hypothetical protein [Actinoplanes derwentensis]|uniref:hypothetical protein n=1 Tax=Actinoplanes derwentensis TaxID=113562 RepID=UPI0012FDA630|nr:hypothetical protein [Actinoplanes derwentensis]